MLYVYIYGVKQRCRMFALFFCLVFHEYQNVFILFFSCVNYVPEPDDTKLLKTSLAIYQKFECYPEAMRIAIQLNDMDLIKEVFLSCSGRYKQHSFRLKLYLNFT